jgi:acyl-CoA dehydrogenase
VTDEIRRIIKTHARLPVDADELPVDADLFRAGMTSHASVNVMLALEDAFDCEFPDEMLRRDMFESIASIHAALSQILTTQGATEMATADTEQVPGRPTGDPAGRDREFLDAVRRVAAEVAAPNADDVDRRARFPHEAVEALRREGALSAYVPSELGGGCVSLTALAEACFELGRRCGAAAMVYAMHQIQVVTIVRHFDGAPWFAEYLRELSADQRLIASATSEVGTGGDMGRSIAAVTPDDDGSCTFEKLAPTVSYGADADDLFTTLRSHPEAEQGDQVIVLTRKEQTSLEQTSTWDPLGMRGTCSPGYVVRARFSQEQVLPVPFSQVSAESMVPISHILWANVWLGIATDAFDRARSFVRGLAKQRPGDPPPVARRLSYLSSQLALLRATVASGLDEFEAASGDDGRERLATMVAALRFNNLKIAASERAPLICQEAMAICGIMGYKNDSPFSIGRHLRDALSARLMVANERLHETNASLLLIAKEI